MTLTPGCFVRVYGHRSHGHAKVAKVVAVNGDKVTLRPGGHKKDEVVDIRHVRYWKAGNAKVEVKRD